jgi:hypothetical protein
MQLKAEKLRAGRYYILDMQGEPIPALNMETWGRFFERPERHILETRTKLFWVSTVFLGINHNWDPDGPPIIFESMAFLQPKPRDIAAVLGESPLIGDGELGERYSTRDHAIAGHIAMVAECLAMEAQHKHADLERILRRKAPSARRAKIQMKKAA